jgi:hypothetical protein
MVSFYLDVFLKYPGNRALNKESKKLSMSVYSLCRIGIFSSHKTIN